MAFTWSFSKLNAFETCPKKYYHYSVVDKAKRIIDRSDSMDWGEKVHGALEVAIQNGTPLPTSMEPWQKWVDMVRTAPGETFVENKYGLTQDLSPCEYFAPAVWYRGKADVVKVSGIVGHAIDWKTGKRKEEGSIQLGLMALCVFQHHPGVQVVFTDYVWLNEYPPDDTTRQVWKRSGMKTFVSDVLPRVKRLEAAHETNTWEPKPSGLCVKWCKVTSCPFHGKGSRS